jgi:hypothetical protein
MVCLFDLEIVMLCYWVCNIFLYANQPHPHPFKWGREKKAVDEEKNFLQSRELHNGMFLQKKKYKYRKTDEGIFIVGWYTKKMAVITIGKRYPNLSVALNLTFFAFSFTI